MAQVIPPEIFNRGEIMLPHEILELITELLYKRVTMHHHSSANLSQPDKNKVFNYFIIPGEK